MTFETNMARFKVIPILLAMIALLGVVGCTSDTKTVPPPQLPSSNDTAAIAERITEPDGQAFLREITSESWDDDGRRAGELFAWIRRDAQSTDPDTATRAGHTAHAIASFLADRSGSVRDTPANPVLWQSFARSLVPYLGAMVGDGQGVAGFAALDGFDTQMRQTAAVFAAMHKDAEGNRIFTDAASQRAHTFEVAFAQAAAADPRLIHSNDALEDLARAARLRSLVAAGAHLADPESPRPTPARAQTEVMYQVVALSARPDDPHINPEFFRDGRLLSPAEIPENDWSIYDSQLTVYLAPFQHISNAIRQFGIRYAVIADQ